MNNKGNGFITFILSIAIILIFSVTVFFCLDVFEIIDVPEKYSLANILSSKVEVFSSIDSTFENIIPSNIIDVSKPILEEDYDYQNNEIVIVDLETPNVESAYKDNNNNNNNNQSKENTDKNNFFYYSQLDEYGKIIYSELYNNKEKLRTGTYKAEFGNTFNDLLNEENGNETLNNSFQLSVNALMYDNPELFYLDITKMYLLTEITTKAFSKTYKVSIGANGGNYLSDEFQTETLVNSAIEKITNVKQNIRISEKSSTYDIIKAVHNYLVDTVEYDSTISKPNIYNIYGALINKSAVCEGYARSFKYILDDYGIPCIIACGIGTNSSGETENHAWNYVQLDNKWYAVDATWDDPIIIGTGRIDNKIRYEYFLKGSRDFFKDHFEDGNIIVNSNFKYPKLSDINYE